ncbi:MAG TPA: nitrilase-related carbon-nitrogen hydrolase, partial [Thermoanaerobaculia bacterium]
MKREPLPVAVAQIDATVGDFDANAKKIIELGRRAETEGASVVLFPELAVSGYPPKDFLERRSFVLAAERTSAKIARATGSALWLFGSLLRNRAKSGRPVYNVAVAARAGRAVAVYRKRLLPNYDVFDEGRYFEAGTEAVAVRAGGRRLGVTVCEDIWNDKTFWKKPLYEGDPVADLKPLGADLHVNISASPWLVGKGRLRERMMRQVARRTHIPLVFCNLVGGNDGLVFDGQSCAFDATGRVVARGRAFAEDFWIVDVPGGTGPVAKREEG